jgi:hypothetical protein
MEEEFLHPRKEARQCPNVLQFLGAHLCLHLFRWRIQAKALGAFSFELELQSPHF